MIKCQRTSGWHATKGEKSMLKMKKLTIALTMAMLISCLFGMTVSAETGVTAPKISKVLEMDDDVKTYPKMDFTFTFTQLTTAEEVKEKLDGLENKISATNENTSNILGKGAQYISSNEIELANLNISYGGTTKNADGTYTKEADATDSENNQIEDTRTVTKSAYLKKKNDTDTITAADFEEPGFYVYYVKENRTNNAIKYAKTTPNPAEDGVVAWPSGWEYKTKYDELYPSQAGYIIVIPVGWKSGSTMSSPTDLEFGETVILKITNDDGTKIGEKTTDAKFVNIYQRNDESVEDAFGLEISKTVSGEYAKTDQEFTFTITLYKNDTEPSATGDYTAQVYNSDGKVTGQYKSNLTATFGNPMTFQLKHGEVLKFDKLPVGTTYKISENSVGYKPTATVTEGGVAGTPITEVAASDCFADEGPFKVAEGKDSVAVNNVWETTPITGIVTDNLSFILLIVVAAVGITVYTMMKRRMRVL